MLKNKYLLFYLSICCLSTFLFIFVPVNNVFASIEISEIMYSFEGSDTSNSKSREWIEIYNPDSTPVDITKIKLFEADTNHSISITSSASILDPLNYAIIADTPVNFLADNPNYSGLVFDSNFSLSNTGEVLELRNSDGIIIDSKAYDSSMGADGDGNSLQKINSVWIASSPTPGAENVLNVINNTIDNNQDSSNNTSTPATSSDTSGQNTPVTKVVTRTVFISAHSGTDDVNNYDERTTFQATAGRERMALVGSILEFDAKYTLYQKDICSPVFKWSFGDGLEANGKKIGHVYKFPGEYQVILNGSCGDYNSVSRTKVKMISPDISILLNTSSDLEIINNSKSEINIGNWVIKDGQKDFILAQDTMISANNKITLSSEDFSGGMMLERVSLNNPSGREVAYFNIYKQQDYTVISPEFEPNTAQKDDSNISVVEAERLIKEYRDSLALKGQEFIQTESLDEIDDHISIDNSTNQTASILESVDSTPTSNFWSKLIDFPAKSIKSFVSIFYNF